ncbi:GrpE, mitochondrial [Maublancomyces gigas]|uniref:GrpE protein homolog n=1 Tax=Discina gigas TaxID=1032678 RepID=A0ABR3GIL1_9PEZI
MFRRALFQQTRQFSRGIITPGPSLVRSSVRQWQVAPSLVRVRRTMSTESKPKPAEEAASSEPKPKGNNGSRDAKPSAKPKQDALQKELEKKTEEARDFKDKFTRTVADFRNLQDRTERDKKAARDFAIQKFAKDLVDSVDNLDRALTAVPEESRSNAENNKDLVDLYNGLKMTESILLDTLKKHGLEKIDPIGQPFDPNRHEATFQAPMPDKEPNTVFLVQQTGFVLNGRTIRAAKVGIVASTK